MSAIFESVLAGTLTVQVFLLCLLVAGVCGGLTALTCSRQGGESKSFLTSLVILPMVVCTVITMVNGNVGTGIAVAGAFSLVRFRSAAGRAKDIARIFLTMTAGLACAAGYIGIALLFTILVCAVVLLLSRIPMGQEQDMELHITVPESLHFSGAFDDLFDTYLKRCKLTKVRTSNLGSLYKLSYRISMKQPDQAQAFLDALRCRNGNLEISLVESEEGADEL